jgi:pimeloyl-ACP methyl ester carboxylesterase
MAIEECGIGPVERYTTVSGEKIYSQVLGSGPPVVLLHGLGGSCRWWGRNMAPLARHHELHIVDLAGCGRSSGRLVLAQAAEHLATWMELSGLQQASIIGHSMGGFIASRLAASYPQLIDQLVLVNAAMSMSGLGAGLPMIWRMPLPLSIMPVALGDITRVGLGAMARATYELSTTDMGPTLARVLSRTLLVWGEHDQLVPLRVARAAMRRLPSAVLAIIGNAGHVPMWDRPAAFNHAVLSFLAGVPISAEIAA